MIDNSLSKFWNIAYDSLKVAFRGGEKVCVVHEKVCVAQSSNPLSQNQNHSAKDKDISHQKR